MALLFRTTKALSTVSATQRQRWFSLLSNEQLITALRSRSPPPENVRIVPDPLRKGQDESSDEAAITEVVPLQELIQRALQSDLDIVEISLQQETPVVTLSKLTAMAYQQKRKAKQSSNNTKGGNPSSVIKEVVVKSTIAENDFLRKVSDMEKFLRKGHPVTVTVRAKGRELRKEPEAVLNTCQRVVEILKSRDEVIHTLVTQPALTDPERGNLGRFMLRPGSTKNK